MGRLASLWRALVALLALSPGLWQAGQTPLVFRSGVDLVPVDVVVTDGHNKPITDLTKADFEITEQGRPQVIKDFVAVSIPSVRRPLDPLVVARAPKIDVATNLPPSPTSRAFVMVIDDLHIVESETISVRRIITEFVQDLGPDDEAAIIFASRSDLSVDLTRDPAPLLGAADHVRDALGFGEDASGATTPNGAPLGVMQNARSADFVLQNVAASLAGSRFARRAMFYVSDGPTVDPDPCIFCRGHGTDYPFIKDVYDAAHRADVPIYTVDPRGLVQPEQAVRGGIGALGGYGAPDASVKRRMIATAIRNQQDRLRENAAQTGGLAAVNQNDLPRAIDELVADNGTFYVLSYYPDPFVGDGKFHPISVKVTRPGAHVRARAGYVASAAADVAAPEGAGGAPETVDHALGQGVSVADIALRAVAAPVASGAKGLSTVVTVDVIYPVQGDGPPQVDDDLDLKILALDPDGKVKAATDRVAHVSGLALRAPSTTFQMDERIDVPSGRVALRIGVTSRFLGKTGTVQIPVDIPRPADGSVQVGSVVLGLADGPPPTAAFHVIEGLVPFQPTTGRTFRPADALRVFVPVFWSGRDATAAVTVSVPGLPAVAAATTTVSGVAVGDGGHWQGAATVILSLGGVPTGSYGLQVEAHLANGQTATRLIAFAVQGYLR